MKNKFYTLITLNNPRTPFGLVNEFLAPLALIFRKTVEYSWIPSDWRNATPIYKKGSRTHAENYRPISLSSNICKIMETFVKEVTMKFLVKNSLLSKK